MLAFAASTLAACVSARPPALGQLPTISPYGGADCLDVLVVGDSIAQFVGDRFESRLEASGRCTHVVQAGQAGSGVVDWLPGGRFDLARLLSAEQPDVVFASFVGNESFSGLTWSNPTWHTQTTAAALALVDLIPADVALYWGLPAKGAWRCEWGSLNDQRWGPWHAWIRDTLPVLRPSVHIVDWRTLFGGETFQPAFTFPDGQAHDVRLPDCVHFSADGADLAALLAVAAMQGEWTAAPPGTTAPTTATTAPPDSEPSTTTTPSTLPG
jgi:hypothetical protein